MSLLAYALMATILVLPGLVSQYAPVMLALVSAAYIFRPSTLAVFSNRRANPIEPIFVAVFLVMAVTIVAAAKAMSEWRYALNFLALLVVLPVSWRLQRDARPEGMATIARAALAGTCVCVAVALFETRALGMVRAGDIAFNPIQFGDLSILLGFVALAGMFAPDQHTWQRACYLAGPVLGIVSAYLSGTRGAIVAVPVVAAIGLVVALRARRRLGPVALMCALGVPVAAVAAVLVFGGDRFTRLADDIWTALKTWHSSDLSTQIRLDFWRAGARAFLDSPIWGHGWNHMVEAAAPYMPDATRAVSPDYGHLHNDLVNFAVSAGVLGLLAYVAMLAAPILGALSGPRDGQRTSRLYAAFALSGSFAAFGLTNVTIGYGYTTALFVFVAALIVAIGRDPAPSGTKEGNA